ncbi:YtxH domain-containing protein [Geoalkalibacter sp.]|uniref:YtxH domain-containing protein n=1 Tax=Geoalkalibacter sp. TaxID=3041440 RepID=UPI00272E57BC|nr:YtxH domain-containing protein [Geoalkalibacter sp.]
MTERGRNTLLGALLLLAGGTVGAAAALLYAPQSGRRTRRQVSRNLERVRVQAEKGVHDAATHLQELIEDVSDQTGRLVGRGEELAEETRRRLLRQLERGEKALARRRRQLSRWVD